MKVTLLPLLVLMLALPACSGAAPPTAAVNATPTPGSMTPLNPEAAHMMQPLRRRKRPASH